MPQQQPFSPASDHLTVGQEPRSGPAGPLPDTRSRTAMAVFQDAEGAHTAYQGLLAAGFPAEDVSLLHRPLGLRPQIGVEQTQTVATTVTGVSAGGLLGGIAGLAAIAIPGLGPLLALGPLALILAGIGVGSALGGLVGTFAGLGMPTEEARRYEDAVRRGGTFIAVRHLDEPRTAQARQLLARHGAEHLADYETTL